MDIKHNGAAQAAHAFLADVSPCRVLVAVSGGADSVALLRMLADERDAGRVAALYCAHYNHGLRLSADEDEEFVRELCQAWEVPFVCERGDVAARAARYKRGIEETARDMRYAFLERVRVQTGMDWITTAHTADDNAETLLLNLTRGAGLSGLCGIPPRRGNILRPLLTISKAELLGYLQECGIAYREDETNTDERFRRNYIRSTVMPALRQCNPSLTDAFTRTAVLLREDEEYLAALAREEWEHYGTVSEGQTSFPAKRLAALPGPVASRLCRLMAAEIQPYPPERVHIMAMRDIAKGANGRSADLAGALTARKCKNTFFLERKHKLT